MRPDSLFRNWKKDLMTVLYSLGVAMNCFIFGVSLYKGAGDLTALSVVSGALCGFGLYRSLNRG